MSLCHPSFQWEKNERHFARTRKSQERLPQTSARPAHHAPLDSAPALVKWAAPAHRHWQLQRPVASPLDRSRAGDLPIPTRAPWTWTHPERLRQRLGRWWRPTGRKGRRSQSWQLPFEHPNQADSADVKWCLMKPLHPGLQGNPFFMEWNRLNSRLPSLCHPRCKAWESDSIGSSGPSLAWKSKGRGSSRETL